jgi:phage tail sheath protein FI
MPEYLAPGVYVEEVDTGNKPIEGVSTSNAGMVGVTERGPENVAVLVTSVGEFRRIYGDLLDPDAFRFGDRGHDYLPHAVDGFFTNGGRRAFVVRVLPEGATRAQRRLFDRGVLGAAATALLRPAPRGSGTGVNPPFVYVGHAGALAPNEWIRIGDGSRAEYHQIAAIGNRTHVALSMPLNFAHDSALVQMDELARAANPAYGGPLPVQETLERGAGTVVVAIAAAADRAQLALDVVRTAIPPLSLLVEVGNGATGEYRHVVDFDALGGNLFRLHLDAPLLDSYEAGSQVVAIDTAGGVATPLGLDPNAGDAAIYANAALAAGVLDNPARLVSIGGGDEVRRIGQIAQITLDIDTYRTQIRGSIVQRVTTGRTVRAGATTTVIPLSSIVGAHVGMEVIIGGATREVTVVTEAGRSITVAPALGAAPAALAPVTRPATTLRVDAAAGSPLLELARRVGLAVGDVLLIGPAATGERMAIAAIVGETLPGDNPGRVVLTANLQRGYAAGTATTPEFTPRPAGNPAVLVFAVDAGAETVVVSDGSSFAVGDTIALWNETGDATLHRVAAAPTVLAPLEIELQTPTVGAHETGGTIAERVPLIEVHALDRGRWGNRLRVSIEDEVDGLASRARLVAINPGFQIRVSTSLGIEPGTILELGDPVTGDPIGPLLKVRNVDVAAGNLVDLDTALAAAHINAHNAAQLAGTSLRVRSREFRLTVRLLRRPDPAVPSRNDTVIDSEMFRHLSMDVRHSRYAERVVGAIDGELRLWDRRPEGESRYVRLNDLAPDQAALESIRLGPEPLVDVRIDGRTEAARHPLSDGDDAVPTFGDPMYLGADHIDPDLRTGIHVLRSVRDIALIACPGQTTVAVQQALIDHCEEQRYRFAVLDARGPQRDSLADVQQQRQQFDTRYAALYHPWLLVPDPTPSSVVSIEPYAIPPSGHLLGVIARTDIERGVHKAPANEVVRGITGLQRSLNKAEQDLINPSPVNINVIRDFRPNNRGIRVWGSRVITSDTDYKYVNVRRLLIFLEDSIERGLGWVVFEPNSQPTWARVRRAISNFLTVVWRNGALEGTTVEQAFFVKCDRTTMTQTDIDSGRLIVVVGVAPVKPAEYVIIRIGLWSADAEQ